MSEIAKQNHTERDTLNNDVLRAFEALQTYLKNHPGDEFHFRAGGNTPGGDRMHSSLADGFIQQVAYLLDKAT